MFPRFATLVSRMTSMVISMLVGVRQQREITRTLDRGGELALVERLGARDAARHDLAGLGDVLLECGQVLVVDQLHALCRETAELATARERAIATTGTAATRTTTTRFVFFHQAFTPMSSSSPPKPTSSRRSRRGPPSFSSCAAFAIGDGSVTASSMLTTRWRSTASEKRNAPVSSCRVFWSVSTLSST